MALTKTRVTGRLPLPNDEVWAGSYVQFQLRAVDTDKAGGAVLMSKPAIAELDENGGIAIDLWPNGRGDRDTVYQVKAYLLSPVTLRAAETDLGIIVVPPVGPVDLVDLLQISAPVPNVPDALAQALAAAAVATGAAKSVEGVVIDAAAVKEDRNATEAFRNEAAAYANAVAAINGWFDTIALGRAGVADGETFGVRAGQADGLKRPTIYRRDSATTQSFINEQPSGVEVDALTGEIARKVGGAEGFVVTSAVGFPQVLDANHVEIFGFNRNGEAIFRIAPEAMSPVFDGFQSLGFRSGPDIPFPSTRDANDVEIFGFDQSGRFFGVPSPDLVAMLKASMGNVAYDPVAAGLMCSTSIVIVGDSMSTGVVNSNVAAALLGREVSTLAKGGHTAYTMSVIMGVNPLTVTLTGNQIPASGGVVVTERNVNILTSGGSNAGTANVSIQGIKGLLTTDASGNWTFTRATSGSAVTVAANVQAVLDPDAGTSFIPATNSYRNRTLILRLGRNGVRTTRADRAATLEAMRQIIDFMTPRVKNIIVVTPYNGRNKNQSDDTSNYEGRGTAAYANMMLLIDEMKREFGRLVLDMRESAVKNAIYDIGLTPTAGDLEDIAADCIPRQLFNDNIHVNAAMQAWEGRFIGNHARAIGF